MRTLVVLPTYNEVENVPHVTRAILAAAPDAAILVVDDASPDGTGDLVARMGESEPRIRLLRRAGKLGLGTAYLAGFRHALDEGFDRVVTMDCDLSHDPAALPALLAAADTYDLVIGSRYVAGGGVDDWPWHRRALSAFANRYTRALLGLSTRDCTSGYRVYGRRLLERVEPFDIRSSGYSFLEEMAYRVHRAGLRIGEVPIVFHGRLHGTSKINRSEIWRAAWHVLRTAAGPAWNPAPDAPRANPRAAVTAAAVAPKAPRAGARAPGGPPSDDTDAPCPTAAGS